MLQFLVSLVNPSVHVAVKNDDQVVVRLQGCRQGQLVALQVFNEVNRLISSMEMSKELNVTMGNADISLGLVRLNDGEKMS